MTTTIRCFLSIYCVFILTIVKFCDADDILGCGGFVKSHTNLDFSKIEIGLYTKEGSLKEKTECAPTNGYYFLPIYEKGDYVLKIHPPAGWSFEPSQVDLSINGDDDQCSLGHDVNFSFNGFGITGRVITAGEKQGPSGITVQLVDANGKKRETITTAGGDFHFTPVIPGKYTVKASHPKWKLEPSQTTVEVKEGNTALPVGTLAVRGYDVKGSIHTSGNPISGLYVLLYSKNDKQKYRVEGCKTALLQGVPDSPICHSVTDANGEFSFGLVPAGEYKLLALSKTPGQATVTYNIKPEQVEFTVKHDSLFIKHAFEVTGFTVTGSVLSSPGGAPLSGARVALDGAAAAASDAAGKYTLPALKPGDYAVGFEHELSQFDPIRLSISPSGVVSVPAASARRWRVCGAVRGGGGRRVLLAPEGRSEQRVATADASENWCTFLEPGVYSAKVEVSEQEQRDGLQFYPVSQSVRVSHAPITGVSFSQLKATLSGRVRCGPVAGADCTAVPVTVQPLSPDGTYVGKPIVTNAKDGYYSVEGVLPGSVEVSVSGARVCWAARKHNAPVAAEALTLPDFVATGRAVAVTTTHEVELVYKSALENGSVSVPAGSSRVCVAHAAHYEFTPRSCHQMAPVSQKIHTGEDNAALSFTAVAHQVGMSLTSAVEVDDLTLRVTSERGERSEGPLRPSGRGEGGDVLYEYTVHLAEDETLTVSPQSASLLFSPASVLLRGAGACQPRAAAVSAQRGLVLTGALAPPVDGAIVSLHSDDLTLTQITGPDGKYRFGPLDASKQYKVTAEKESFAMSEPDAQGVIHARKLAEIVVTLVDEADGSSLEGALVSVSGGSYRRTLVAGASGRLAFAALPPAHYYVKPHMKEYKFTPPHATLHVAEGATVLHELRGVRVAFRLYGRVVSWGGAGRPALVAAQPLPETDACAPLDTRADDNGHFRLRGLVPGCSYAVRLRASAEPQLQGLALAHDAPVVHVKEKKDIYGIRLVAVQPNHLTDASALVHTPRVEHYKTLTMQLSLDDSSAPIFTTKLDASGYRDDFNPGLMYPLPRLPADNKTYAVRLESTLSKTTHSYELETVYFVSDGRFKQIDIKFLPKLKTSEQELRASSLLAVPLLALAAAAFLYREALVDKVTEAATQMATRTTAKPQRAPRAQNEASAAAAAADLAWMAAPAKRQTKKKTQLAG